MRDNKAIETGNELYEKIVKLKRERDDLEMVKFHIDNIDRDIVFTSDFIINNDSETFDLFEDSIIFPLQNTRAYESLSPELEKFFLFDINHGEKNLINKARKDFDKFSEEINSHLLSLVYEIMKMVTIGRGIDGFFVTDTVVHVDNLFQRKHYINFFFNYHQIKVVRESYNNDTPLCLHIDKEHCDQGVEMTFNISSEALIKNKVSINNFLNILSSGCSGAVKIDKMKVSTSFFDNVSIYYMGNSIYNITKHGDFEKLSNKKKKYLISFLNFARSGE